MRRLVPFLAVCLLAPAGPAAAADPCASGGPEATFLGVVYDADKRDDFQLDVDHFESFLSRLRGTYCIPDSRAEILAFEDGYARNGVTYRTASEANVRRELGLLGAEAPAGSTFFFMLSSHGNVYARRGCSGAARQPGSFSALAEGDRQDGIFYDCDLGAALTERFDPSVRMLVVVDCSFCGGFSDSLTAVSGTVPDGATPTPSGVVAPGRVVITGCAITTECFGSDDGGRLYSHLSRRMHAVACDGWTAPRFPEVQGIDLPVRDGRRDGRCSSSEWLFAAVDSAYSSRDYISIQQQFRIKYGFPSLAEDIAVA